MEAAAHSHHHADHAAHGHPPPAPGASGAAAIYTCPMHPEVRQDHPGNCPKCGMTLEPLLPELEAEDNPELRDFQRRFWWTLPLSAIVFVLAMFGHRLQWLDMALQSWVELLVATPIVLWAGWPFFTRGWQSAVHRSPNMCGPCSVAVAGHGAQHEAEPAVCLSLQRVGHPGRGWHAVPLDGLAALAMDPLAMSLSSVSVIGNALRLRRTRA